MKPMPKVTPISLQDYNSKFGSDTAAPLYVLNQSSEGADIIMNALGDNGRNIAVVLPFSFAPLDITIYAPRNNLINSSDFRRLLALRLLYIIDNDSAEIALKDSRVADELNRIFAANNSTLESTAPGSIQLGSRKTEATEEEVIMDEDINPIADQILGVATSEASDSEVTNAFIRNLSRLETKDLEYLRRESQNSCLTNLVLQELG